MATSQLEAYNTISILAGEDLSAAQYRFVKLSSGKVVKAGAGEAAIGVLLNKPASGEAASIQIGGVALVSCDAAVTQDDKLMSSGDGQCATKTGTNNALGVALASASTAATIIPVKLEQSDGVPGGGVGSFEATAITPTVSLALITIAGTDALTLADATIVGQEINIHVVAASATPIGTLTLNDAYTGESATIIFNEVGQRVRLKWTSVGWKLMEAYGLETVTATGALEPAWHTSYLNITGTVAYTLAAGTRVGQRKRIECLAGATTPVGTVTVADMLGSEPTAWVFTTVGQAVDLEWHVGGWHVIGLDQIGLEVVANAATANPLCLMHHVDIVNTVDFIQGAGLVAGQRSFWVATASSGSPVGTVSGLFYTLAGAATGIDVQMNAASDAAYLDWLGARWHPTYLVSTAIA